MMDGYRPGYMASMGSTTPHSASGWEWELLRFLRPEIQAILLPHVGNGTSCAPQLDAVLHGRNAGSSAGGGSCFRGLAGAPSRAATPTRKSEGGTSTAGARAPIVRGLVV